MASNIDPTKPTAVNPLTADVRTNFGHAKDEVEALQTGKSDTTHNHDAVYSPLGHDHDADYADIDHDASHIRAGSDEVDGDKLDIDYTPTNYTPDATPPECDHVDHLTAHLKGIDTAVGAAGGGPHASTHIDGGSDPIDGDKLEISWAPSNVTPDTSIAQADSADDLAAILAGIDNDLKAIMFRAYLSSNQDFNSGTETVVIANTIADQENSGSADYNTSTGVFTCPYAGVYLMVCNIEVGVGADGDNIQVRLYKGATQIAENKGDASGTANRSYPCNVIVKCAATNTLDFRIYNANTNDTVVSGEQDTQLCVSLLRRL